jgi:nascent polypeptide-associated complex subunit alpha
MFPGLDPKKMQGMMKQMGINQEEIEAARVTIEKEDGGKIVIHNPNVVKIDMQGQENFQVSGDVSEVEGGEITEQEVEEVVDNTEEDIKTLMEKCNCLEDEAKMALEKANGDLTEAILELSE